jgi:uncharacterized protein YycO
MQNLKHLILKLFTPIQKWIQRLGYIESEFTVQIIRDISYKIKAGDVLLSYESGRYTSAFIKGEWDHAAIVDDELFVIEAVGDKIVKGKNIGGVRRVELQEWLWKKNHVVVLRHYDFYTRLQAAIKSKTFIGRSYDYQFKHGEETLYCSELVHSSYKHFDKLFMIDISDDKEILPIDYLKEPSLREYYNSRKDLLTFNS